MTETSLQVVAAIKEKDFWKTARWVSYTNKYNERLISYMGPGTGPWNISIASYATDTKRGLNKRKRRCYYDKRGTN